MDKGLRLSTQAQPAHPLPAGATGKNHHAGFAIGAWSRELLDALLEAGAKVIFKYAKDQDKLEFRSWAHQADCPDLTFLADSEHAQLAAKGLGSVVNDGQLPLLVSHAGTRKLLGLWLEPRLPENPTPIQVAAELQRLAALLTSEGARHYPRQLETLVASLDAAKLLAHSPA